MMMTMTIKMTMAGSVGTADGVFGRRGDRHWDGGGSFRGVVDGS